MLILHRMTQLGVMTQKRPEIWVSHPKPHEQASDKASVSIAIGDHILKTNAYGNSTNDDLVSVSLGMGDHKLYDPTPVVNQTSETSETKVSIAIGDHILKTNAYGNSANDDLVSVSLGMGDHKLYFWGVSAQSLDEDNTQVSIAIGDHKLYEE